MLALLIEMLKRMLSYNDSDIEIIEYGTDDEITYNDDLWS